MRTGQYLSAIAMFMIFLVVLLPLHSSLALAATINSVGSHGKDGFAGYRAQTDTTVVNVSVTVPEDADLGPGQVKILEDPTRPFDCTLVDNVTATSVCVAEYPEQALPSDFPPMTFTVQLLNDAGGPLSPSRQGVITVDSLPPKVHESGVTYSPMPGGAVVAAFDVEDVSCTRPECIGKCVGVGSVKFTVAGLAVGQNESFGSGCSQNGTINITGLVVGSSAETKHICLEVADKFGQSATSCKDVLIDASPPQVTGVALYDINGKPITFTNGQPMGNVEVKVNITEDSAFTDMTGNPDSVTVDASDLTERPEHKQAYKAMPAKCDKSGTAANTYTCRVSGFLFTMTSARTMSVRVMAKDQYNNILNESRQLSVSFDNTPPAAGAFSSDFRDDKGVYWLKEFNNTISLSVTDAGAGMNNKYVMLDLSMLGAQDPRCGITGRVDFISPSVCEPGWTCKWYCISATRPATGSTISVTPMAGSRDDAGNPIVPVTGNFRVDRTAPTILKNMTISALSDIGTTSYVTSGDMLTFHTYIEDYTPVTAVANFSNIMPESGFDKVDGICAEFTPEDENVSALVAGMREDDGAHVWDCKWEVGPIVEVPKTLDHIWTNTTVMFNVTDLVGLSASKVQKVDILGEENVTPNYWKFDRNSLTQSPSMGLDRFVWGLGQPTSFQHFKIVKNTGPPATILSFEFDPNTCVGDIDYLYYSDAGSAGATFMSFNPDTSEGIDDVVMLEFNAANAPPATWADEENNTYPLEKLYINCTARIRSIVEGSRISMLEDENITFEVSVFNNPLGQNIGNVKKELEEVQKVLENDWWGIVKWPKIILDYAKIICDLLGAYENLRQMWTIISGGLGAACEGAGVATAGAPCGASLTANQAQGVYNQRSEGFVGKFLTFCAIAVSCRATSPSSIDGATQSTTTDASTGQTSSSWSCPSDNGWCKFQLAWSQWNNQVIGYLSGGAFLPESSGQRTLATTTVTKSDGTKVQQKSGGYSAFKNISFVSGADVSGGFDVKKSLISSALTGCLPGVLGGIDKYRQLRCEWLLCYKINIAYGTMTPDQCDQMFYHGVCKYVAGEIFNAIPFYQYVNGLMGMIRNILTDPFVLIGYAIDIGCSLGCSSTPGSGCVVCTAIKFLNLASQVAATIGGMFQGETWKAPLHDICEEAFKEEPSYSNLPGFPPSADPAKDKSLEAPQTA